MPVSAGSHHLRLASLITANLLLPIAVLVFAFGFFPYKPVLPGLSDFEDGQAVPSSGGPEERAPFDKVIFMVVDALRSDFVFGHESAMGYVQSLIRDGSAIPFTAHATPPTVTMPRVKALTTGSVPSFLDLILNFAESDTSSSLAAQDTWLAQLRRRGEANGEEKVVFYGDDTWLKLFPGDFFWRSEGTSSFFVSDFTQVDNNVTRHLPGELQRPDWNALIMHYLGLDHIGHKTGPHGPAMLPKQREMDDIFRMLYESVQREEHLKNTLVVLVGDHGMNAGGNHGGSGPGETEPALVFASPKFSGLQPRICPTDPKEGTEFEFYRKVQQSDVVPTLAGLMGFPVPKNSLGVVLEEIAQSLPGKEEEWARLLRRNAQQVLGILKASSGIDKWDSTVAAYKNRKVSCDDASGEEEEMACMWAKASALRGKQGEADAFLQFLQKAQDALSSTASSYEVPRMVTGIAIAGISLLLAVLAFPSLCPPSLAGSTLAITTLLYGIMMFASSYVEEEQQFWYWITPAWLALLAMRSLQQDGKIFLKSGLNIPRAALVFPTMACHRLMVRWNQTGQKRAGEPDIAHGFFPSHHILMWGLIFAAYLVAGVQVARVSFKGIMTSEAAFSTAFVMILPAIVFKLNFTQADAPELVLGLGSKIRAATAGLDLVTQARVMFVMLTLASAMVVVGRKWSGGKSNAEATSITLADRFHVLLTLFLVTQTRAPNIPLFLLLEVQRFCFARLLPPSTASGYNLQTLSIALTSLLLSQTTYFAFGGSNSISSIDLSNAYNGVADYNIVAVGILLFAGNWAGAIWWCSAAVTLLQFKPAPELGTVPPKNSTPSASRLWIEQERAKLRADALASTKTSSTKPGSANDSNSWTIYITATTVFTAGSLVAVMTACTLLRTHLFIWTVFSPKYLYAMAWAVGWHLIICVGLGRLLTFLGGIA